MRSTQEPQSSIDQEQSDQQRRTVGATLASLGTTHSNPSIRDAAADVLTQTLAEAFPNAGNHKKAGRKMAEDMGKAGFTPGPWRVSTDGAVLSADINAYGNWHIARTDRGNEQMTSEDHANARLIAASPELFAACEEFVRFAELPNTVDRGDYIRYQVKAIAAAKAALAKAGGGR